jgi:uncharacterized metal-binding protein
MYRKMWFYTTKLFISAKHVPKLEISQCRKNLRKTKHFRNWPSTQTYATELKEWTVGQPLWRPYRSNELDRGTVTAAFLSAACMLSDLIERIWFISVKIVWFLQILKILSLLLSNFRQTWTTWCARLQWNHRYICTPDLDTSYRWRWLPHHWIPHRTPGPWFWKEMDTVVCW